MVPHEEDVSLVDAARPLQDQMDYVGKISGTGLESIYTYFFPMGCLSGSSCAFLNLLKKSSHGFKRYP